MNEIIEKNKEKVVKNRHLYETNKAEFAVRAHLIEPVLNKLGWTTSDPDLVIPNLRTSENDEPDYTLKINNEDVAYVEAKKLSYDLKSHIGQLARYCTNQGIEFGILTDGMKWILFKAFEKGKKAQDRIIWEINFEKDTTDEIKARLNTISFINFPNLQALSNKHDRLNTTWENIVRNPERLKSTFIEFIKSDLENSEYTFELLEIENFVTNKLQESSNLFQTINNNDDSITIDIPLIKNKQTFHRQANNRGRDQLKDYIIPAIKQIKKGNSHSEVFHKIANELETTYATVSARCTRDLGIQTDEFIDMINNGRIKDFLKKKFSQKHDIINNLL